MGSFGNIFVVLTITLLAPASAVAQTVLPISISLTNFAFTPNTLNLRAGVTYRIRFSDDASKGHNFSAPDFFAASRIAPSDKTKVKDGIVELDNGEAVDVTLTPTHAGVYSFNCTHFMHSMLGMHGKVIVQ